MRLRCSVDCLELNVYQNWAKSSLVSSYKKNVIKCVNFPGDAAVARVSFNIIRGTISGEMIACLSLDWIWPNLKTKKTWRSQPWRTSCLCLCNYLGGNCVVSGVNPARKDGLRLLPAEERAPRPELPEPHPDQGRRGGQRRRKPEGRRVY